MKKILSAILVMCMCFGLLAGCGEMEDSAQEAEKGKTEKIKRYSFEVPESWEDGDNSDDMQYYYPKDGMLMVGYSEMNQSIGDDNARSDFITSFGAGMESYELVSEEKVRIAGIDGYRHEMNISMADKEWKASMVTFDCDGGVISFMMSTLKDSDVSYDKEFENVLKSIRSENGAIAEGHGKKSNTNPDSVKAEVDVNAVKTQDGLMCTFITNNSDTVIDELEVQINYKDENGTTIDTDDDGHDMVLPGSTVVSRLEAPDNYAEYQIETSIELGVHSGYENHTPDVKVNANQGDKCVIVELTNNAQVSLDEVEYVVVLYKGDQIVTVEYPKDIMNVPSGKTVTEKIDTYDEEYDRFEVYLNQAHTFGL